MKRLIVVMILIASSIFANNIKEDENLVKGQLENGLKYYIYANEKPKNGISVRLRVETGSLYEKEGEEGIAHFLEHMAFNGTEKYPQNDLIRALESRGIQFGNDLNAYTSFEETVYMLDGQKKDLEEFLNILFEWGFKVTVESEEVEKEKGVVKEEWRQRSGLSKEVSEFYQQYYLGNSRYIDRLPIGKVPSIEEFTREGVENYYKRWYVPNNMSLFVAGDIEDVKEIEKFIINLYSTVEEKELEDIEAYKKREIVKVDKYDKFVNEQLRNNKFSILSIINSYENLSQLERYKRYMTRNIVNIMINTRYGEKLNSVESNLNSFQLASSDFNEYYGINQIIFGIKGDKVEEAIVEGFSELEQLKRGFYQEEFVDAQNAMLSYFNNALNEVGNRETSDILSSIVNTDFSKDILIEEEEDLKIGIEIIENINLDEANAYLNEFFETIENYYLYEGYTEVEVEDLKNYAVKGKNLDIGPYELQTEMGAIVTKEIEKGKIISEEYNEELDYKIFTLSNGNKVYFKNIDYEKNKVHFTGISKGGKNYINTEDLDNYSFISVVFDSAPGTMTKTQYDKYMQDKNFYISYTLGDNHEYVWGTSPTNEFSEMLYNFYGYMTEGKVDQNQLNISLEATKESIKSRENLKTNQFWKDFNYTLSNNNERDRWLELEDLEKVNKEGIEKIFNERLANGIDYDYYIVGDISEVEVRENIEMYLASLTNGVKEDYKVLSQDKLRNNVLLERHYGTGEEATVVMYYGSNEVVSEDFEYFGFMATSALDAELIKVIREELSGAYSISSWVEVDRFDLENGRWALAFTCDPERVNELMNAVDQVVNKVLDGNITDETISFVKEKYKSNYEQNLGTNDFYYDYFDRIITNQKKELTPKEFDQLVSKENIVKFINSIHGGYKARFVLYPEK